MSMDNNITAKEAREQLLEIWTNCKFGVKELVKKEYSHRAIHYMLSTEAYSDTNKFPEGPWCEEGDWVIFGRYAGARFNIDGGDMRLLNDDEILATVNNPEDILQ